MVTARSAANTASSALRTSSRPAVPGWAVALALAGGDFGFGGGQAGAGLLVVEADQHLAFVDAVVGGDRYTTRPGMPEPMRIWPVRGSTRPGAAAIHF